MAPKSPVTPPAAPGSRPLWVTGVVSTLACGGLVVLTALCLRALDRIPEVAMNISHGERRLDSVDAVRRETGWSVDLPSYFPDALGWPSADIRLFQRSSVTLRFARRTDGATWLLVAEGPASAGNPLATLPFATVLQCEATRVRDHTATVERLIDESGAGWHQLRWTAGDSARVVRYRGTLDELMLIAASIDERNQ
jgi:hypothetical protein